MVTSLRLCLDSAAFMQAYCCTVVAQSTNYSIVSKINNLRVYDWISRPAHSTTLSPLRWRLFIPNSVWFTTSRGYRNPQFGFPIPKPKYFSDFVILKHPPCLNRTDTKERLRWVSYNTSVNRGTKNRNGTLGWCRGKNTKVTPERIV